LKSPDRLITNGSFERVGQCLFIRKPIARIDKPPEVNPSRPNPKSPPDNWRSPMGNFSRTALRESGDDDREQVAHLGNP
jgi:hypothetical protein